MRYSTLILTLSSLAAIMPFASALDVSGKFGLDTSDVDPARPTGDLLSFKTPSVSTPVDSTATGLGSYLTDTSLNTSLRVDNTTAGASSSITFTLDTEASPTGYSLEEFRLFTRQDNALVFQSYDIEVKAVGSGSFTKLNTTEIVYPGTERGVTKEDDFFGVGNNYVETIVSASSGTYFATGIAEFRIVVYPTAVGFGFTNPVFDLLANSYKGMQIVNVSLLGTSTTVPESSTTALSLAFVGLGFAYGFRIYRRKRALK